MATLGLISIVFGVYRLYVERAGAVAPTAPASSSRWIGSLFGVGTGFTSQIAHAGGPPFQMWVMPKRLPRDVFIGTSAIFFAIVNWVKVPAYVALGQFTTENALASLALLPIAVLGSLAGVYLVRKVEMERFYTIIYLLLIATGVQLLLEGLGVT
jgi:uncharacterized membrane protein YfcA